ncbi:MAG: hypothetical protein NC253_00675 [Ruminococcus sp.]|nr:hypothetical protein [Ruminococcus sp.]MCM1381465.1 hypothetical protein [Muribaculaceae bacterium]MCM1478075.1 hypothetical protein [Muribaculaceae bacterium]
MLDEYVVTELWDLFWLYAYNAFTAFMQKSVVWLIIQGVLLTFSFWDKNSRLFVILTSIGVYSVHGSLSMRINLRRIELAAKRQRETRYRQYRLSRNLRHRNITYDEIIFIPEINNDKDIFGKLYIEYYTTNFERNFIYG